MILIQFWAGLEGSPHLSLCFVIKYHAAISGGDPDAVYVTPRQSLPMWSQKCATVFSLDCFFPKVLWYLSTLFHLTVTLPLLSPDLGCSSCQSFWQTQHWLLCPCVVPCLVSCSIFPNSNVWRDPLESYCFSLFVQYFYYFFGFLYCLGCRLWVCWTNITQLDTFSTSQYLLPR